MVNHRGFSPRSRHARGLAVWAGLALSGLALSACGGGGAVPETIAQMPEAAYSATSGTAAELDYWAAQYRSRPGDRDIALRYSARLRQLGMLPQAAQVIGEARQRMPTAPDLATEQARIHLEMGKAEEALAVLEPIMRDPSVTNARAWPMLNLIGIAHDRAGRHAEAEAAYERALTIAPNQPSVLNNYALSLLLQGRTADAEAVLNAVAQIEAVPEQLASTLDLITQLKERQVGLPALRTGLLTGG